jgi:hypothetical protein
MDDQRSLLLSREGLKKDYRCRGFWLSLKELVNLDASRTILHVVIITTDKARVEWFALILVFNRRGFGLLIRIFIFTLLILAWSAKLEILGSIPSGIANFVIG